MKQNLAGHRPLALIAAVIMVFMLFPVNALATPISVTTETQLRDAVASLTSLGATINIDANIDLNGPLTIGQDITLTSDGNILDANAYTITVNNNAEVKFFGTLRVTGSGGPVVEVTSSGAEFTLGPSASIEQTGSSSTSGAIKNSGGTVAIGGGTVESGHTGINNDSGTLTINGGTVTGTTAAVHSYGNLNITDGAIGSVSASQYGIRVMEGSATISGGSISGSDCAVLEGAAPTAAITITGGSFTAGAGNYALQCSNTATVKGGSFTGRVGTTTGGTIHIDRRGGNSLTMSDGVSYSSGGHPRSYLTALPALPLTVTKGTPSSISLTGAYTGVSFTVIGSAAELGASVSGLGSAATVSMTPTAAGSYDLVLTSTGTGGQTFKLFLPVTVTDSAGNACAIGTTEYPTLNAAVAAAHAGDTIRFLRNYDYSGAGISVDKALTFDLNGCIVNLSTTGSALTVHNVALTLTGAGELNVEGEQRGVSVSGAGGSATVSSASVTGMAEAIAAFADDGGTITVRGDADAEVTGSGSNIGAAAQSGGIITIGGNVKGMYRGVSASGSGSSITVTRNVTAAGADGTGAHSINGGHVTVGGDVSATGAGHTFGVMLEGSESGIGRITVQGDVTAPAPDADGNYPIGVSLDINRSGLGNYIAGGEPVITVNENVEALKFGLSVMGGAVLIKGNVTSHDTFGVQVNHGEAVVDGEIYGPQYVDVGNSPRLKENYSFIDTKGYRVYQNTFGDGTVHIARVGGGATQTDEPTVVTNAASGITASGAVLSGNITSDGGASIAERGFVYSTSVNPTTANTKVRVAGSSIGVFTGALSGLAANTTYHVRAYAINSRGTSYGEDRSFTTLTGGSNPGPGPVGDSSPTVVTVSVSDVTGNKALFSGNVLSGGGAGVTERGFVYAKGSNPTMSSGTRVLSGSGTGSFSANISGLDVNTTYYMRAYAINREGTAYGAVMSFTTLRFADVEEVINVPKTGDNSSPWLGWVLLSAAAVAMAGYAVIRRKSWTAVLFRKQ